MGFFLTERIVCLTLISHLKTPLRFLRFSRFSRDSFSDLIE